MRPLGVGSSTLSFAETDGCSRVLCEDADSVGDIDENSG